MINTAYFLALFFISLRISAYFLSADIFFPNGTPPVLKGILGLLISTTVISNVNYEILNSQITSNYYLALFAINEIMTGIMFGVITNMIFTCIKFAGGWMDFHVGFMMTSIIDPATNTQSTLLGNLTYMLSVALFFIVDGHHTVIKCLVDSFKLLPLGTSIVTQDNIMKVIKIICDYFLLGVKIAIPIVLIILIVDLCLGLITKTVPTIPVMIFGVPIKVLLGLFSYTVILPMIFKIVVAAISNMPNIFESFLGIMQLLPIVFIFADDDKTEEATPKKMSDAKSKGQVARSREVNTAFSIVACTFLIASFSGMIAKVFKDVTTYFFSVSNLKEFSLMNLREIFLICMTNGGKVILMVASPIMIVGICASVLQTGFIFTKEPLKFSLGKLKPKLGLKNIFSQRSLLNFTKNIIVIIIISFLAFNFIKDNYNSIMAISYLSIPSIGAEIKNLILSVFKKVCLVSIIIAAADFYFQKKLHKKDMKMSKQEVKDEYKNMEGDPKIKAKIKQKQREMSMMRMMSSVSDATVVITNPTHLAVAIKYTEDGSMDAPKVVAKGADYIAIKIKNVAKENNVPIVENKPLARIMYERVEIDDEIPADLYQGVAEILAVIMRIKK